MRVVGVDLASQPEKSSLCVVEWTAGQQPCVVELHRPADDDLIVDQAARADAIGLDCPLGWPSPFVDLVTAHHEGRPTLDQAAPPRDLRLRTTDQWIRQWIPRDPLSVSTDRLGVVALRGVGIVERIAGPGADRSGAAGIYEAYPGGSLAVWGLTATGYKTADAIATRQAIVDELARHVDIPADGPSPIDLATNADDLDAAITAIVTLLAHLGATTSAPSEFVDIAMKEGWIHVPTIPLDAVTALLSAHEQEGVR